MSEEGRARSQAFDPDELARSLREAAPCVLSAEVTSEDDSLNAIILLERRLPYCPLTCCCTPLLPLRLR